MSGWQVRLAQPADHAALAAIGAGIDPPESDAWWLVAHAPDAAVQASVRVRRAIGLDRPRHWYHVGCVVHAAPELALFHRLDTLLLGNDHTGASELAGLSWDAAALGLPDQARVLQLLVRAALLLIARERERFAPQLVAELPGLADAAGQSPFWHGLGRHFYAGDPQQAQARWGDAWRSHVAALLPRHPVMVAFLPAAAQAAIAQARPEARVAMDVLAQEGLRYGHHVRIDDAGPVFEGHLDTLPGVLDARVREIGDAPAGEPLKPWLVAAAEGHRVVGVRAAGDAHALRVLPADRQRLGATSPLWSRPL